MRYFYNYVRATNWSKRPKWKQINMKKSAIQHMKFAQINCTAKSIRGREKYGGEISMFVL